MALQSTPLCNYGEKIPNFKLKNVDESCRVESTGQTKIPKREQTQGITKPRDLFPL